MLKVLSLQGLSIEKGGDTPGVMGVSSESTGCSSASLAACR